MPTPRRADFPRTPPRDHEEHGAGLYRCAACDAPLFRSEEKYDAGTGFPSFHAPISEGRVAHVERDSHGVHRVQACCMACGAHLGHRFDGSGDSDAQPDAPPEGSPGESPRGGRYCLVSDALAFELDAS